MQILNLEMELKQYYDQDYYSDDDYGNFNPNLRDDLVWAKWAWVPLFGILEPDLNLNGYSKMVIYLGICR